MTIRHTDGEFSPILGLDRATSDALATYVRLTFPNNTRKEVARHFDLSLIEAKSVVDAKASKATLDRIWKHPNGGWSVAVPVMGAVIGRGLDDFIATEKARHERARRDLEAREQRLVQMAGDLPAVLRVGSGRAGGAADRRGRERRSLGR